jgi:plasmid stability protein
VQGVSLCLNVLIRNISSAALAKLKAAAKKRNRSLQQELKELLNTVLSVPLLYVVGIARAIRKKLKKEQIYHSDSSELLREDRNH